MKKSKNSKVTAIALSQNSLPETEIKQSLNLNMNNSDLVDLILEENKEKLSKKIKTLEERYISLHCLYSEDLEALEKVLKNKLIKNFKIFQCSDVSFQKKYLSINHKVGCLDFHISDNKYDGFNIVDSLLNDSRKRKRVLEFKSISDIFKQSDTTVMVIFEIAYFGARDKKTGNYGLSYRTNINNCIDKKSVVAFNKTFTSKREKLLKECNEITVELHKAYKEYVLLLNEKRAKSLIIKKFLSKSSAGVNVLEILKNIDFNNLE